MTDNEYQIFTNMAMNILVGGKTNKFNTKFMENKDLVDRIASVHAIKEDLLRKRTMDY
jgi:ribosomal protein S17E